MSPPTNTAPPELTPQQAAAIQTRAVSIALSAGAGCGKTFVLTRRFLSHLEPGPQACELSRLVAITYTERAAREMRERIRSACHERLRQCPTDQVDHWLEITRELDSARVSTIHSFCATLLRTHAVEARLDPQFGLLDATTGDTFLHQSVTTSLAELLSQKVPEALELVYEYDLEKAIRHIKTLLEKRYRLNWAEVARWDTPQLMARWRSYLEEVAKPVVLQELGRGYTAASLLRLLHEYTPAHPKMQERRAFLLAELPRLAQGAAFLSTSGRDVRLYLEELQAQAQVQGGGTKRDWPSEEIFNEVKKRLEDLRKEIKGVREFLELQESPHLETAAHLGLHAARLTQRVGEMYDARKRSAGVLDFDDLLCQSRDLLRDSRDVRRRAASGISLLMVDEFQDTDPLQAEIVRHLSGDEMLSGKLFLVGDAKQSIYRFRRAEPRVFHELREQIPATGRLPLNTNFRSQPAILNFVNALFEGAMPTTYEPLQPSCGQLSPTPAIEFLFAVSNDEEGTVSGETASGDEGEEGEAQGLQPLGVEGENASMVERLRECEADWIARRIWQLLHDGVPRIKYRDPKTGQSGLRPAEPRDIVILLRAMTNVRAYEAALREYGLNYYVVGGHAFFAQQEVYDVINLCSYLDDADDQLSLLGLLRSPFFGLSDDSLFALAQLAPTLSEALEQPPPSYLDETQRDQIQYAHAVLQELRSLKDRVPLSQLLQLTLDRTGYDAALLAEFLGERKLANLRKLLDMARQFDLNGEFTLADFVQQIREAVLNETKESLAATHPESSQVIRLMSVHQSKGLEFPIVIVADMDRQVRGQTAEPHFDDCLGPLLPLEDRFGVKRENLGVRIWQALEKPEAAAEIIRLLYVATTRAADYLILSAGLKVPGKVTSPWLKLLDSRFDLLTGQPRLDPTKTGQSTLLRHGQALPEIHVHHQPPAVGEHARDKRHKQSLQGLRDRLAVTEPTLPTGQDQVEKRGGPGTANVAGIVRFPRDTPPSDVTQVDVTQAEVTLLGVNSPGATPREVRPWRWSVSRLEQSDAEWQAAARERGDEELLQLTSLVSLEFQQQLAAEEAAPPREHGLTTEEAEQLGTLVHNVLERWNWSRENSTTAIAQEREMDRLLDVCSAREMRRPQGQVLALAKYCLQQVVTSSLASELATAPRCFRELEFVLPWNARALECLKDDTFTSLLPAAGDGCVTGKLDCVYQTAQGQWVVLDYKTGWLGPHQPPGVKFEQYGLQLGVYCLAVRHLIGQWPDRVELVLLRHGVQRLSAVPTPAFLLEIVRRVTRLHELT